ncbi:uncharacterized protein LOC124284130 [Haliotis rubra]|uniref:uncharacterized protein LOC124284130 n=1 Tax=Haliotis rubra TaxID=36100 RepID=UPI001EE4F1BB|nr:uncharacterized protein LOC124284130 [Haliotis rubra]
MTFCGEDWLRGARRRQDLEYLFRGEILEEFDDMRLWLLLLRNSILHELQVTRVEGTLLSLWKLHEEVVRSWSQTSRLFLSGDRSPSIRDSLISIYNIVTTAADKYSLSRLLPPPIFEKGELVRPSLSSRTTLVRKSIQKTHKILSTTAMTERRKVQKPPRGRTAEADHLPQNLDEPGTSCLSQQHEQTERCEDVSNMLPTVHEFGGEECTFNHNKRSLIHAHSTNYTCGKSKICSLQ